MKKLITASAILLSSCLPLIVFAAYNDVTLNSNVSISVGGHTLNVVGTSQVIESITIEGNSFNFVLQPNSTLKVSSPDYHQLTTSASQTYLTDKVCTATESSVQHSSASGTNIGVTISVKDSICPAGSSSGGSSGGGSGGGGSTVAAVTPVVIPVNATMSQLQAQLNALLAQLNALQGGQATPPGLVTAAKVHITQILFKGSRGESVKGLQQFLNNHGFIISASGAGSLGNETDSYGSLTEKAVGKFQEKYGIAKPGESGYGRVGPKTRAKVNELMDQ